MHDGVLKARLRPPRLPAGCLPRDSLVERVAAGFEQRLVAIVAGAGYGKSVLLAQALDRRGERWVWC